METNSFCWLAIWLRISYLTLFFFLFNLHEFTLLYGWLYEEFLFFWATNSINSSIRLLLISLYILSCLLEYLLDLKISIRLWLGRVRVVAACSIQTIWQRLDIIDLLIAISTAVVLLISGVHVECSLDSLLANTHQADFFEKAICDHLFQLFYGCLSKVCINWATFSCEFMNQGLTIVGGSWQRASFIGKCLRSILV